MEPASARKEGFRLFSLNTRSSPTAVSCSHGFEGEQLYLFHCHILEHEDAGMMLNVAVV